MKLRFTQQTVVHPWASSPWEDTVVGAPVTVENDAGVPLRYVIAASPEESASAPVGTELAASAASADFTPDVPGTYDVAAQLNGRELVRLAFVVPTRGFDFVPSVGSTGDRDGVPGTFRPENDEAGGWGRAVQRLLQRAAAAPFVVDIGTEAGADVTVPQLARNSSVVLLCGLWESSGFALDFTGSLDAGKQIVFCNFTNERTIVRVGGATQFTADVGAIYVCTWTGSGLTAYSNWKLGPMRNAAGLTLKVVASGPTVTSPYYPEASGHVSAVKNGVGDYTVTLDATAIALGWGFAIPSVSVLGATTSKAAVQVLSGTQARVRMDGDFDFVLTVR